MNQEIKTTTASIAGSEEDDWETAEFPTVAQPKTALPPPISSSSTTNLTSTADALALANLRPSAPTFQPRTTKPPTPRLWEPEPPAPPAVATGSVIGGSSGKLGTTGGAGSVATGGMGRSVLLGPVVDAKDGPSSHSAGLLVRGRSISTSNSPSTADREEAKTSDIAAPTTGSGASPAPGASVPASASTPIMSKPTILKRLAPALVPAAAPSASASSPFGDDEEWSRDPRAIVVSNSEIWEQANNSAPMPALPKNAPPMPTAASLRILRRPSPATSASSSSYHTNRHSNNEASQPSGQSDRDGSENGASETAGSAGMGRMTRGSPNGASGSRSGSRRNKTLVEREEEYKRARERIFGTTAGVAEGEGSGQVDSVAGDNRSEVSGTGAGPGYDSGSVTPARSGSSSTGSIVSGSTNAGGAGGPNNVHVSNGPVAASSTPGQQIRSGSVGPGGNLPTSASNSSLKNRTGPTQSNKRRGESHFEPLRPPTQSIGGGASMQGGAVGGGSYTPASVGGGASGFGRGTATTRDRMEAGGGYGGGPGLYQGYDTAPYGGGFTGGMPYQGSLQQQQQGFGGGAGAQPGGYTNYPSQFTGYPSAPSHPQVQPQLGMTGGYGRMPSSGNGSGNGYGTGPLRQPIGPGDVDGMGMGFGQLRMSDSSPYGASGPGGMQDVGSGGGWNGHSRPAYSSSSSSASSDVGSSGAGGGPGAGGYLFAGNGGYAQDKSYRSSGPMSNHQPYAYPTMQSSHLGYPQHGQPGVEQPQPGYLGGRVGPGQYGQPWQNIRKGSGENGSGDSGYTR